MQMVPVPQCKQYSPQQGIQESRLGQIGYEVDHMDKALMVLWDEMETMRVRLEKVMRAPVPTQPTPAKNAVDQPLCTLAQWMKEKTDAIEMLSANVASILSCLEL